MTDLPYMPLWVADYRADTAHLSTAEHGAYLLLIMHYWQTGALPTKDDQLARIAGLKPKEWLRIRPTIIAFFDDQWRHKRIDEELIEAREKHERRVSAGKSGGNATAKRKQYSSNAPPKRQQSEPETLSEPKGSGAHAPPDPKADLFVRGRQVLGKEAGALIAKLLRSIGKEDDPKVIAKARARIEEASTKAIPAEWLGRIMAPKAGDFKLMSGMEGVV